MTKLVKFGQGAQAREYPLTVEPLTLGRAIDNTVVIEDPAVSKYHAVIERIQYEDGQQGYVIKDLQSTNKTFVNGKAISQHPLTNGDEIRIGLNDFKFDTSDLTQAGMDFRKTAKLHKSWIPGVYYTKDEE